MKEHGKFRKVFIALNILSLVFIALIILVNTTAGSEGGLGLLPLVPILWAVWGLTFIADIIALPIFARWLVRTPKLKKDQKFVYVSLLITGVVMVGYLIQLHLTKQ